MNKNPIKKSLNKSERLKGQTDFKRVFSRGIRVKGSGSRLIYFENGLERNRFAVSPVRKYGTAVRRNRAKRICREAYRNLKDRIDPGYDLIVVIYPGFDSFAERRTQIESLCSRAGLMRYCRQRGS